MIESKSTKALIFKIQKLPSLGLIYYLRVYSGVLSKGEQLFNLSTLKKFRINRIMKMHVTHVEDQDSAVPGNIIAVTGIVGVTGDTLSSKSDDDPLYPIAKPENVVSISIKPTKNSPTEYEKIANALKLMVLQDPSLSYTMKEVGNLKEQIISGMGELHLQIVADILKEEHKLDLTISDPKVEYKSTLSKSKDVVYTFKSQTGGSGL